MKSPKLHLSFNKKRLSLCIAALSGVIAMPALAQDDEEDASEHMLEEVVVTGMRASIMSAQDLKRDSDVIQDSIVAEDIGKLPDRSIAEALQRVPGVAVSRFDNPGDPEHFAGEGAGVSIRGLTQVRAELNGRDIFSAANGRSLSFDDVPAELMAGVDVIKTPTADMVEGGLGGIVNLRTRMPFDEDGQVISGTVKVNYGDIIKEANTELSFLYSNLWETDLGRFGVLVDVSNSTTSSRADNLYVRAFYPRTPDAPFNNQLVGDKYGDETFYVPRGADWRRNDFERDRSGAYLALQWEPSDELEFYATVFTSDADRTWYENGFFLDGGGGFPDYAPIPGTPITDAEDNVTGYESDDWVFDSNNVFVSGTITTPNGIPFGTSSRLSDNQSKTTDISFGGDWISGQLAVSADFQNVTSTAKKDDFTLGTVLFPAQINVENMNDADGPNIYDVNEALGTLTNYSFGQMQSLPEDNEAESTAMRLDVEYDLENSLIDSVKSGIRFSERTADNKSAANWSARIQPWNRGVWADYATISENNPLMQAFSFDNFQRGNAVVPVSGWMFTEDALANYRETTDAMIEQTPPPVDPNFAWAAPTPPDFNALDLSNPDNVSTQKEETTAIYLMANLAFSHNFTGNVGVRYVRTTSSSLGYIKYPEFSAQNPPIQPFYRDPEFVSFENDYSFVLPSLNIKYNATEDLVFRFSASQQIWKPEFWRTGANATLSAEWVSDENATGYVSETDRGLDGFVFQRENANLSLDSGDKNPLLEPMTATQLDVTAEWYFNEKGGMLYGGIFKKEVADLFLTQDTVISFQEWDDVSNTSVVNIGKADVLGFEVGGTYYFDFLGEPWNGLGVNANYTYIDSSTDVPNESGSEPVDTDGSVIDDIPLAGLAENTYNLTFMFEKETFYARFAYNWHSEIFQDIGPNGWKGDNYDIAWRLPVYSDAYGQLDFSAGYNINESISLNFEASNILQADTKGIMRQNAAGDHTAYVYTNDVRYGLSLRVTY